MRGKAEQIDSKFIYVCGNLADALHSIGMEVYVLLCREAADLLQRLDGSHLVVGMHYRDEDGVGSNSRLQGGNLDQTLIGHRQIGHLKALFLQLSAALKNGRMLDPGGNYMFSRLLVLAGDSFQGQVIGFRTPGGEDYLLRLCAEEPGHLFAGLFQSLLCLQAEAMQAGGVAEFL